MGKYTLASENKRRYRKNMPRKIQKKVASAKVLPLTNVYQVWGWILLIWSLYRYFLKLPEWVDEFIAKPLVFVLPVIWYVAARERRTLVSLGLTSKKFFNSVYIGLAFGAVLAVEGLISNAIKYGELTIRPIQALEEYGLIVLLVLSLATAYSEELLSRGFIFGRIYEKTRNLPYAAFLSTLMFMALHVPILVTSLKFQGLLLIIYFATNFVIGLVNSFLYAYTGSLVAPILVHLFWNMTVALYL